MGRTKRKRKLKRDLRPINLFCDDLIKLQTWLSENSWKNYTKLKIKAFPDTGRGVTSKKSIQHNDVLISMPIRLMITYCNTKTDLVIKEKLTMQELLALFLITEKIKEHNSNWHTYIQSLPEDIPLLPWLATPQEISRYPEELRLATEKTAANFKKFMTKVKRALGNTDCVLQDTLCKWAYVMVNTRAVYVDPTLIPDESWKNSLLDEPSMALCPFLDMFNHHFLAKTEATLVEDNGKLVYQLRNFTGVKKNEQIFISYGPHDNITLLTEYGFFLPGNIYDTIKFDIEDVLKVLELNLNQNRYKFIKERTFDKKLYVGYDGISYNLKIVLFVGYTEDCNHLNAIVFSDSYPRQFLEEMLPCFIKTLLHFKSEIFKNELRTLRNSSIISDCDKNIIEFVNYRIRLVEELKKTYF